MARPAAVLIALGGLGAIGLTFTADSASFDGARWRVAAAATREGWAPRQVNGGFEWSNYYRGDKLELDGLSPAQARRVRERAGDPPLCITVHVNPRGRDLEVIAVARSSAPTRATARLVAFRTDRRCSPQGTSGP